MLYAGNDGCKCMKGTFATARQIKQLLEEDSDFQRKIYSLKFMLDPTEALQKPIIISRRCSDDDAGNAARSFYTNTRQDAM